MKSRWDQTLISLAINQRASEDCIPNMVAISKPQLSVSYLRGSEKSVLLTRYMHMNTACLLSSLFGTKMLRPLQE